MKKYFILLFLFSCAFAKEVWVEGLNGIVFSDSEEKLKEVPDKFRGTGFYDLLIPDQIEFREKIRPFFGKPITAELLTEIKSLIVEYYRDHDYPIVAVLIPTGQDITHGVIRVLILVGKIGQIKAEGARWISNEKIAEQLREKPGEIIKESEILCDLDWINQNPFVTTDVIFEPGKNISETDLILVTEDRFPLRVYSAYENTGNLVAGSSRFLAGFNFTNPVWWNHQLNGLFLSAPDFNEWWAVTGSYIIPTNWRQQLEIYGAFTRTRPDQQGLDLTGKGWQIAGRYTIPFCLWFFNNQAIIGYEFKRTNNFLNFAQTLIFDHYFDISQFVFGFESSIEYEMGITSLGLFIYYSPGHMTSFNRNRDFQRERNGAKAHYTYGKFRLDQALEMPLDFSWIMNLSFQQSNHKLLPTEEFSLGGYFTVRGYDENEVIGDNGLLIKNEIRTPKFTYKFSRRKLTQVLQFLIFLDFGVSYDVDQNILSKNKTVLASIGPGIRYTFHKNIIFRFDYGWQLHTIDRIVNDSNKHSRAHFGLTVSF